MMDNALTPTYRVTCPYCNGALYPIALDPESAPWLCVICSHSWWAAELSEDARARFRPSLCDFGYGPGLVTLQGTVLAEREDARARRTSVRSDQVQLLPLALLKRIPKMDGEFGDLVTRELERKSK